MKSKIAKINKSLNNIDFSVINSIQLKREDASGNNIGAYLVDLRNLLINIKINEENSLFESNIQLEKDIDETLQLLNNIKNILGNSKLSSYDSSTIRIGYSENSKPIKWGRTNTFTSFNRYKSYVKSSNYYFYFRRIYYK